MPEDEERLQEDELLKVDNVSKYYAVEKGILHRAVGRMKAVDSVSLTVKSGETLGLVGESGCGKTTTARMILRVVDPSSGSIFFRASNGETLDITRLKGARLRLIRKDIQMIFQDPYSSLNPRMRVKDIVTEPLIAQHRNEKTRRERAEALLDLVGLSKEQMMRYPHAFSGGQRQRIGIARALAINPSLVICDEPVSALDVSIQSQILNLLKSLQDRLGLTYVIIAHDLSVIRYISDEVAVMYLGSIVEFGAAKRLFSRPLHPYTAMLMRAIPLPDPHRKWEAVKIVGEVPDTTREIVGCPFASRCDYVIDRCRKEKAPLVTVFPEESAAAAACFRARELELPGV